MNTATIVNIQKYCIHDGDGIRTTIFFKGCPLRCAWCHNPESIAPAPQLMTYAERCMRCGACVAACPERHIALPIGGDGSPVTDRAACTACGVCVDACVYGAREIAGTQRTVEELVRVVEQDRMFYETSGGGVTLSGGEVLAQNRDFLVELVRRLHKKGYNVAVDTCGYAPWGTLEAVLPYVSTFLYDLKLPDRERHFQHTGRYNDHILANLKSLSEAGARLHIRIPVIAGVNASDADMDAFLALLRDIRVERVSLLPYHRTGSGKRDRVGLPEEDPAFGTPTAERMETMAERFRAAGYTVQIGG